MVRYDSEDIMKELQNITLSDITVIATLGVGGFGRVELVSIGLIRGLFYDKSQIKHKERCMHVMIFV